MPPERILVVDDEDSIREVVATLLAARGYQCTIAVNGREALQKLPSAAPDLILSDIVMPEMDGLRLLENVQARNGDVPVIMVTAMHDVNTAIEAIRRAGIKLAGSVEQSATVDEESGGFAGVAYLAANGHFRREAIDYVVITEPLDYDRICLGHRGVYWFEVLTRGRIAHGSMPFLGASAIDRMARFIASIEQELNPKLALRRTRMPVVPEAARSATINVNAISGGQPIDAQQTPCVADVCRAVFDRRFLLEEPFDDVRREVLELLSQLQTADEEFRYELKDLMIVHPTMTAPESKLVTTMASAITSSVGRQAPLIASPGTYDQKHFARIAGIEQCIAYGPGILNLAHQPDEYCEIEHLILSCKAMALGAIRLLGVT